mmetsp:Transcript_22226/g.54981  ORF Transcript_22226/g.54981 Transcript_22226/m.54981 type:complete len:366 (-) Transcript_22226:92-1189(-)
MRALTALLPLLFVVLLLLPATSAVPLVKFRHSRKATHNGISSLWWAASDTTTYAHAAAAGGGVWADAVPDLAAGRQRVLACGSTASFLLAVRTEVEVDRADVAPVTVKLRFDGDSVGGKGLAFATVTRAVLNEGDAAMVLQPGNRPSVDLSQVMHGELYDSMADEKPFNEATIEVSGMQPNEFVVVRVDTKLSCQPGSTPSGVVRATLHEVYAGEEELPSDHVHGSSIPLRLAKLESSVGCGCVPAGHEQQTKTCVEEAPAAISRIARELTDDGAVGCTVKMCVKAPQYKCVESGATHQCTFWTSEEDALVFVDHDEDNRAVCRRVRRSATRTEVVAKEPVKEEAKTTGEMGPGELRAMAAAAPY